MRYCALGLGLYLIADAACASTNAAPLFSCAIGGKQVTVTQAGKDFVYRFGTASKPELTIVGDPAKGNLFRLRQRFAGPETQVRFTNGAVSYIVFSAEGNPNVGARSIAGVTVMQGAKAVSFLTCNQFAEFDHFDEAFADTPDDTDAYSGM